MIHAVALALALLAQPDPAPAGDSVEVPANPPSLVSPFVADMDHDHPLPEHPRPLLIRSSWLNLNGPWHDAITDTHGEGAAHDPDAQPVRLKP